MEFDYVIVGGGTAGCILANRLSADPGTSVCLIEAGKPGNAPLITIPLGVMWLLRHKTYDWGYVTEPQAALDGREIMVPRGRALGGSSAINGMVYIRGLPSDYDTWAAQGCPGWAYRDVLPYFRKSVTNGSHGGPYHGSEGELPISDLRDPNPAGDLFLQAAQSLQIPRTDDFNGARTEGVGRYQTYTRNGQRVTAADAFVRPVLNRPNLTVLTDRKVQRLRIEGGRAIGVETDSGLVAARAEVILSAGAFGSAQILMLSGIGPGAHLQEHGIEVLRDLPVGEHFQDHPNVMLMQRSKDRTGYGLSLGALPGHAWDMLRYFYTRRGMWASMLSEAGGFVRAMPDSEEPDVQFHFVPFWRSTTPGRILAWGHGVSLHVCVLRPEARGTVRLRSNRPGDAPRIDPALLGTDRDMATMLAGVKLARRILNAPPLGDTKAYEALPGDHAVTDDDILAFIRARTATVFHPVGTCRMGPVGDTVVDPELRVHGIGGLRVADASIMPNLVSGNTNAAAMMIAEKAADLIAAARLRQVA